MRLRRDESVATSMTMRNADGRTTAVTQEMLPKVNEAIDAMPDGGLTNFPGGVQLSLLAQFFQ